MKIAVECQSPLLQKSLELFLAKYLSSIKQCDIVLRDRVCLDDARCMYISSDKNADIIKPFSKSQLILEIEKRYKELHKETLHDNSYGEGMDFGILEKRIEYLTQEYQENIIRAVKAFYEK